MGAQNSKGPGEASGSDKASSSTGASQQPPDKKSSSTTDVKAIQNAAKGMIRSASGADINEKTLTQLVPIERLAQVRNTDGRLGAAQIIFFRILKWISV